MKQVDNFIRNPLGIIALFLSVIYGIAGYVISNGFSYLHGCCERIGKFFPRRSHSAKHGEGFDVPPTYGQHVAVELTEDNLVQFFIPKGFAHGFAVLSETAVFQYKCDNFYHPEADGGISILDDTLGIDWKIPTVHANLSEKDTKHAMLKDFDSPFDINVDLY